MAIGKDLLNVALVVGGGYIIIYHVLPALQSGQIPGFAPGGTFLPPAAAASTGHRCWPIGNGHNACACAGKQWFQMGQSRTCPDCIQFCNTGAAPAVSTGTGASTSTSPTAPRLNVTARGSAGVGARATGSTGAPVYGSPAARAGAGASARVGVSIPAQKVTNNCGGTICTAMHNNAGQKVWRCANKCKAWLQGPGWLCKGRLASSQATGAYCNP